MEAEPFSWWLKGCHGRRMEAQWSLNGHYWSAKGGTVVVQGKPNHSTNWYTMFTTVQIILWGDRPMDQPPLRHLCNCFEHAQNFMARSERPLRHTGTTKATFLPPICLERWPSQFCGCTMEAQRSQKLCEGGISDMLRWEVFEVWMTVSGSPFI